MYLKFHSFHLVLKCYKIPSASFDIAVTCPNSDIDQPLIMQQAEGSQNHSYRIFSLSAYTEDLFSHVQ